MREPRLRVYWVLGMLPTMVLVIDTRGGVQELPLLDNIVPEDWVEILS